MSSIDLELLKRLDDISLETEIKPETLAIDLTHKCPNLCAMCCADAKEDGTDLNVDNFIKWFDEGKIHDDIHRISITGGEAIIHEKILQLLEFLKKYGLTVAINTSGCANGQYHELYYKNLQEIAKRRLINILEVTWSPGQGKDSWERIYELLKFYERTSPVVAVYNNKSFRNHPFQIEKKEVIFDSQASIQEFRDKIETFLTTGNFSHHIGHEDYSEHTFTTILEHLKSDENISEKKVTWSGRTGEPPTKNITCHYTSEIEGGSIFEILSGLMNRPYELVIKPDETAEICCSIYAGTPFRHPLKIGSICENSWSSIKGRYSKAISLLSGYKEQLMGEGLQHDCYTCIWDSNHSFEKYLKGKFR
jgi:organic radical activating enzyme